MTLTRWMSYAIIAAGVFFGTESIHPWLDEQIQRSAFEKRSHRQEIAVRRYHQKTDLAVAELDNLIDQIPTVARARFAIVRPPLDDPSNLSGYRFDIIAGVATNGHALGEFVVDKPISDWGAYLGKLVRGESAHMTIKNVENNDAVERMKAIHMREFVAVPILNKNGALIAAIFVSWDIEDPPVTNLPEVIAKAEKAAQRIGSHPLMNFD
jgi:hypothetical protein